MSTCRIDRCDAEPRRWLREGGHRDPLQGWTLSGAYKVAALDTTNKIRALDSFTGDPAEEIGQCL